LTTTPCARASLPPSNANCSSDAAVPLRSRHAWPASASSKASTIPPGGTPPWGIARPFATNRRCKQTDSPLPPEPSTKTGQLQGAAQLAMMLSLVALVGEYRANAGHDREGSQEQPLEDKRVIDIGGGREAGDRHALAIGGNVVFGASLGPIGRIGTGQIATALGPHRAGIEDQVWMAAQHGGQQRVYLRQQSRFGPARQNPAQGRSTGLIRGGPQTAPGRPLTQKAPQCRYNPDSFGRRVARATA